MFDYRSELLLRKRAVSDYHSPKPANACCIPPLPGESLLMTARRRPSEEMGFVATLAEACAFSHRPDLPNRLSENEFEASLLGSQSTTRTPNPAEVSDWNRVSMGELWREVVRDRAECSALAFGTFFNKVMRHELQEISYAYRLRKMMCQFTLSEIENRQRLVMRSGVKTDRGVRRWIF